MIAGEDFSPGERFYSEGNWESGLKERSSIRKAVRFLEVRGGLRRHGWVVSSPKPAGEEEDPLRGWLRDNKTSFSSTSRCGSSSSKSAWHAAVKADANCEGHGKSLRVFCRKRRCGGYSALVQGRRRFSRLFAWSRKTGLSMPYENHDHIPVWKAGSQLHIPADREDRGGTLAVFEASGRGSGAG